MKQEAPAQKSAEPVQEDLIGQRIFHTGKFGSIRYLGKLRNNPKAGDSLWLGVEWDKDGEGKHNGTTDGEFYFKPEFHPDSENSCSFLRYGKVPIGGESFRQAILDKYKPQELMTEEEKEMQRKKEEAEQFIETQSGIMQIELYGVKEAQAAAAQLKNQRDINLANMRISSLGEAGMISKCIPDTYNLYLDKNLLYSWDQYFEIIKQLPSLRIIVLNGNKFRKIPPNYLEGKDVADLTHYSLSELVFVDMGLDWG